MTYEEMEICLLNDEYVYFLCPKCGTILSVEEYFKFYEVDCGGVAINNRGDCSFGGLLSKEELNKLKTAYVINGVCLKSKV